MRDVPGAAGYVYSDYGVSTTAPLKALLVDGPRLYPGSPSV